MEKVRKGDPELLNLVADMRQVGARTYATFFSANMGGNVHAFIEINGVISKYIDLCENAALNGIDFRHANVHNGIALPLAGHDVDYLAEKLLCMFGPSLKANPEVRRRFLNHLQDGTEP